MSDASGDNFENEDLIAEALSLFLVSAMLVAARTTWSFDVR